MIQNRFVKTIFANDIDTNLINYYNAVQNDPMSLIREISAVKKEYTAETFNDIYKTAEIIRTSGSLDDGEKWAKCGIVDINNNELEVSLKSNSVTTFIIN